MVKFLFTIMSFLLKTKIMSVKLCPITLFNEIEMRERGRETARERERDCDNIVTQMTTFNLFDEYCYSCHYKY